MTRAADLIRRVVDVTAASAGLVVLSPVLIVAAVVIRLRLGRGVIFRQQRLGVAGRPFALLKFRTMAHPKQGREGPEFDGERLTRLGRTLRSMSIDELPSLLNLLRGEITLVGPRPLPLHYWERFRGEEFRRFEVKPGITGLAQIRGRNSLDWPARLAHDVEYVCDRSLRLDAEILWRTVPSVLRREGIDHGEGVTMHELPANRP